MKQLSIFLLLFIVLAVNPEVGLSQPIERDGWKLVFNDEFEGQVLNSKEWLTWFPYTDDGSDQCAFCRTHGNENQVYLDRNVVLEDGVLQIIAKKEDTSWFNEQRSYTSGTIHSRRAFGHGRYEIKAKLPEGEGFWPAIWTFGQRGSEVDIMEAGMQKSRRFHTSVHEWNIKDMLHKRINVDFDLTEDFHTYAMEWDSLSIKFFIDDNQVWQVCKYTPNIRRNPRNCNRSRKEVQPVFPSDTEKLFLIIGLAIGNQVTPFTKTPTESTVFPNKLEVDYVRIYEKEEK